MRKITFFLFALVGLLLPVSAFAQLEELEQKGIEIGAEAESIIPDTQWYLVYNSRVSQVSGGGYWWDYGFNNESEGYGVMYMSLGPDVVYDGMSAKSAAEYIVRFIKVEAPDAPYDEYYVQFGTGNYVWLPSTWNGGSTDVLETVPTIEEANTMYAYDINGVAGHFGFLTTSGGEYRVDQNGTGATVVIWDSGEAESTGGNNDFTLYPIELVDVSDWDAAFSECARTYSQYIVYSGTFTVGTDPGCYGAEEVAAFEAALEVAAQIDTPDVDVTAFTADDLNQMAQDIIDAYNAVIASRISLATEVADGYYFFNNGLEFTEVTEDYEDPETGETIPGETITVVKGMYSDFDNNGTYAMWKTAERTCPFLWKVTAAGDKVYEVVNMATNTTFDVVSTSTGVTMSEDNGNLMAFDVGSGDEEGVVYIRVSTQAEDDFYYLHCGGHSNGEGVSGNIVGWSNNAGASSWILEPVSDEEAEALIAEYAPEKAQKEMYAEALAIISDAENKMVIAQDVSVGTTKLITSVDQLSSPYTEEQEGSLEALLDEDASTFWHSDWSDGSVDLGTHYLQVQLMDTYEDLVFVFTRRAVNNDHITQWGVYGAPYDDASKDLCTHLAEIYTPFSSNTETLTSGAFNTDGFTILRFYIDDTYVTADAGESRGYGHISEFQLYESFTNPTSQMVAMGEVYTNMRDAIDAANAEGEYLSEVTFEELQAAYDAFIAMFVDPTELRTVLAEAADASQGIVIGTDPGCWSDNSSANALESTIGEATAYDEAGAYTQTQSDTYVETLTEQMAAITEAANKVETGKWYEIRYATMDEIEANGWSADSGASTETQPELYGKYVTVATLVEDDVYTVDPMSSSDLDEICVGQSLYFLDKGEMIYEDYAKFRFINVGDTAYMMQNKATGLFLKAAGTSGYVTLSIHPTLFNVSALGYGENLITGATLDGDTQNNLHAQRDYNQLVTWSTATAGSNSGLYIEYVEDVESDYDGTEFNMSIAYGGLNVFCYPVSVTPNEGNVYGVYVDGTSVTLAVLEDNTAEAGQPFIFVIGSLEDYDEEEENEPVSFIHGYDIEKEAQTSGKLVGTYYEETISSGNIVASGNELVVSNRNNSTVYANSAYINGDYETSDVITVSLSDETYDSIETAVAAAVQDGNIYSIDGKLLGKGNLNSLKSLGKGIYIVNGVKVAVK